MLSKPTTEVSWFPSGAQNSLVSLQAIELVSIIKEHGIVDLPLAQCFTGAAYHVDP